MTSNDHLSATVNKQVTWLVITEVWRANFRLVLQHILANSVNFCITSGLSVTIFHSMCILCVYVMALYSPTLQFYLCVYVSLVCRYVLSAGMWRPLVSVITTLLCCKDYSSLSSAVPRAFSALCVYSNFEHHPHPVGYLSAKFCFFRGLHCWASLWRKIRYSITQSLTQLIWCPGKLQNECRHQQHKDIYRTDWWRNRRRHETQVCCDQGSHWPNQPSPAAPSTLPTADESIFNTSNLKCWNSGFFERQPILNKILWREKQPNVTQFNKWINIGAIEMLYYYY